MISSNIWTVWNRRPGDVGLYFLIGMICLLPLPGTRGSSRLRGASRTPSSSRSAGRRTAPGASSCRATIAVRTASTFDPSSFSTARLTSTFVASGATSKTSVRPFSRISVVFSVISGRRMTSVSFIACLVSISNSSRTLRTLSSAALLDSQRAPEASRAPRASRSRDPCP